MKTVHQSAKELHVVANSLNNRRLKAQITDQNVLMPASFSSLCCREMRHAAHSFVIAAKREV
jgi:hypothetical protein